MVARGWWRGDVGAGMVVRGWWRGDGGVGVVARGWWHGDGGAGGWREDGGAEMEKWMQSLVDLDIEAKMDNVGFVTDAGECTKDGRNGRVRESGGGIKPEELMKKSVSFKNW